MFLIFDKFFALDYLAEGRIITFICCWYTKFILSFLFTIFDLLKYLEIIEISNKRFTILCSFIIAILPAFIYKRNIIDIDIFLSIIFYILNINFPPIKSKFLKDFINYTFSWIVFFLRFAILKWIYDETSIRT